MAESFEDLGLRAELVEALQLRGWKAPSSLQRAAIPVIRRGGNAVLRASAGAGVLGAYALPLLERVGDGEAQDASRPWALVLTPTPEVAAAVATSLAPLAEAVGLRVHALGPGWPAQAAGAAVLTATPQSALGAVRASRLKLDGIQVTVLDGAGALFQSGAGAALEALVEALPRDAQRVVVGDPEADVADFVERHVRRALTFPPVAADAQAEAPSGTRGRVGYLVVDGGKLDALVTLLEQAPVGVVCRTDARAERLARDLTHRGMGERANVTGPAAAAAGPVVSYDVPFDADELAERHKGGGAVIVSTREVAHLRRIAGAAGFSLESVAPPVSGRLMEDVAEFRERLLEAVRSGDLAPQLLVLEPLLKEASMAELAAAACVLARRREVEGKPPSIDRQAKPAPPARAPAPGEPFIRLFMSIGQRDDVGPGDILGAITGESGIDGSQVGRIDIGDTFTTVEVESGVARRVIDALNGTTLRSRSLRVDYDRKGPRGGRGGRRPAPRGGPRDRS